MSQTFADNPNARFFTLKEFKIMLDNGMLMVNEDDLKRLVKKVEESEIIYGKKAELVPMVGIMDGENGMSVYFTSLEYINGKFH